MESNKSFEAVENDVGLKEMEQRLYDWVGEIQQTELPFNKVRAEDDPTPSPIGIIFKYGCFFALMIGMDGEDDQIKFWVDLLEHRWEQGNHGDFLVELTLMEGDLRAKCTLTLPKSANATVHEKLPVGMKMRNLIGWSLKVKIEMLEGPEPMPLSNEVHAPVEVEKLDKATQIPILKEVGTNTDPKTMDQNTQTVFTPISMLALMKLCEAENNKETKDNADGSVFEANPFLVETGSQTKKDDVLEVGTNN